MEERDPNLSQAYRDAPHPEPSPALDARILDAARRAVAKTTSRRRPSWFAWAVPFSSVAVLVLGVTLLFEMQQRAPEVIESLTAMPPDQLDQTAPAPMPADAASTQSPGVLEPARPPKVGKDRARPLKKELESTAESAAPERTTAAGGAPAPQAFPAQSGALQTPPPPPPAAKAEARPAPLAAPVTTQDAAEATLNQAARRSDQTGKPPMPAAMTPTREGASALGRALEKRKAAESGIEPPEQMLETIRRLLREGRQDEARQALERLRQAYPGFEVPEELKGL